MTDHFELNASLSNKDEKKKHFQRFAKQLSDWYCKGKTPELASQDTRFTLELQKQKLQSLGLTMQIQIGKPESDHHDVGAISYGDSVFVNSIIGGSRHFTTTIRNSRKQIYTSDTEGGLSIVMQDPRQGGVPAPDTAMCCPNCGAPSTLARLESGCAFCNTSFLMDELYPKVMHFFIHEDGKAIFDTREIKKYVLVCSVLGLVLCAVSTLFRVLTGAGEHMEPWNAVASGILASAMFGVLFGGGAWFIVNSIRSVRLMGKNARGGSKTVKSLLFCHKMHTLDPTFSTEYFRDKSMSLLKLMLYSQNPEELTICQCDRTMPEKLREIVDITYQNSGVNKYRIRNGVCDVSLTFYTDSLHYHGGKIRKKSDKIRMSLRKVMKKPTDLGFSIMAVNCPSCGASFEAAKVKACPFCGNAYPVEENEWVVTDISARF